MEKSAFRFVKSWSCLGGVVLALGLPPINLWLLAPVAMFGVCALLSNHVKNTWRSWFFTGLSFGFGYFIAALHWIGFAFFVDAKNQLWMMPFALGGLALFLSIYWGLAFAAAFQVRKTPVPLILSLPIFLATAEWLRGHLFTGFPWASPGLITDGMGGVGQLASIVGLYGLTFCILLWSILPWHVWNTRAVSWRVALIAISLPVVWLWGEWRLAQFPTSFVANVKLRLVQPNISQSDKWRESNKLKIFEQLMALSARPADMKPTVIVWPESSVPFLLDESTVGLARIGDMLGEEGMLVAGAIRREKTAGVMDRYFTSVLTINGRGTVTGHYDKWRLVPGGEFLPLAWLLEPLGFSKIANLPESFTAGDGPHSLEIGNAGLAAPLICYEAVFPDNVVDATKRPHWLVNVTNDGWFGKSVGPWQHLAQARMRAIEQGLPLVRAANTGVSAVIDPAGRVIAATQLGTESVLDEELPNAINETVFARYGALPWALLMLLVMFLLGEKPRKSFER